MKKKKPTKQELADLWCKVDNEGFGYYMLQYGPDLDLLERMGFDSKKIKEAIETFSEIEQAIMCCEKFVSEE